MTAMNPTRTLKVQLTEHLRWHGIAGRREAHDLAVEALDRVGIPEPARRIRMYPFQLSGGMRQRAMIAMSIVARPSLLIADEPTTAVDVTLQRQVLDVLKQLRDDGLAIIVITHDLGVARYFCDDVIVMKQGRVVESATMGEFIEHPAHPYSRQLLDSALDIDTTAGSVIGSGTDAEPTPVPPREAPTGDLVVARDLVKIFHGRGGDVPALTGVDVTIAKGQTVGVVGESGSGKSTLARVLMRLVEPTEGTVRFDATDALAVRGSELKKLRRRAQMVFQDPYGSLLPHLTAVNNVLEPLRVHGVGTRSQRETRARELLELVGIEPTRAHHYPRQFSGGQQQRIAIARALALEPELLVCDEPTSALDVSIQTQVLALLEDLQRRLGLSMLFITHNLAVAQRLCDRILVMAGGHIVEAAATDDLFSAPHHPYTKALLAAVLPVRGEPMPWRPGRAVEITLGDLVEVAPAHWARVTPDVSPKETA
jgi:peptide/nickel transport system ATP-binding protein